METIHNLLKRQLKRFFYDISSVPVELLELIKAINNTYYEFDSDRELLERSLELSSNELLKTNSEMRAIFKAIPDLLFRLDYEGTILDFKAGGFSDFLIQPRDLIGKKIQDIPLKEIGQKFFNAILQVQKTNSIVNFEYSLALNEVKKYYDARLLPLPGEQIIAMIQNITQRKQVEEAILKSEQDYRNLFERASDAIIIFEPASGTILEVNNKACEIYGFLKREFLSVNLKSLLKNVDRCEKNIQLVLQNENFKDFESSQFTKDGEIKHFLVNASVIEYNGQTAVLSINRDITARKKVEKALIESENMYRTIFENTGNASIIINEDTTIALANDEWIKSSGYSKEENEGGMSWTQFVVPEDLNRMKQYHVERRISEDGAPKKYEFRFIRRNGEIRDMINNVSIIPGTKKSIATMFDITERKRAEADLLKVSQAIRQSPASIVITDAGGLVEYVNPKFTEITGYTFKEVKEKKADLFNDDNIFSKNYENIRLILLAGEEWRDEFQNRRKDGTQFWESVSISPIKNSDGDVTNFLIIKEDITEKKNLELDLKQALDRSEESDKLKTSLLSNMSHEFRTPMTGILGMATILKENIKDGDNQAKIDSIIFSGKRLMNTLDAVLELADLEADVRRKAVSLVNIADIAQKIIPDFQTRANAKGLTFISSINGKNLLVRSRVKNLAQIILQLLDNAVKFTSNGSVEFSLKSEEIEGNINAKITITDTGIGIAQEFHSVIFEEFRQVSEGHSRSHEGSGLGLSLIKKITDLLNGRILLKSELGKGSEFTVILPAEISAGIVAENKPAQIETTGTKAHEGELMAEVLLVEDNDLNKEVTVEFLTGICNIDHAHKGITAINMARIKKYSLILMDINLGFGMNGVEASKEIKKLPGYKEVPIVALTGYSMESDKYKFLSEGLTHFLAKPFGKFDIIELVKGILES